MKALHLGALLAVCVVSSATAQTSVGPVAITNTVNGVPVTVNATSWITVNSSGNELTVQARCSFARAVLNEPPPDMDGA